MQDRTAKARRREEALLEDLRVGRPMPPRAGLSLVWLLSLPTILAELSAILMEYIDAAMVGRIGAEGAAAIGLVASSTWLFWGVLRAASTGFSVLVAQEIGARRFRSARSILAQGLAASTAVAAAAGLAGAAIAPALPRWLGGSEAIAADATRYFLLYMLALPVLQVPVLCSRMLQAAGDMRTAGAVNVLMCALDVVFNFLFIFPSRTWQVAGLALRVPGLGLGVAGAAAGTVAAEAVGVACSRPAVGCIHSCAVCGGMLGRELHGLQTRQGRNLGSALRGLLGGRLRPFHTASGRSLEGDRTGFGIPFRPERNHMQRHQVSGTAVFQLNEPAVLPVAKGTHHFSLRVIELVGHVRNTGGPARIHHAEKIEIDLELCVIGILHVLIDKKIRDQGGTHIAFTIHGEHSRTSRLLSASGAAVCVPGTPSTRKQRRNPALNYEYKKPPGKKLSPSAVK